MKKVPKVTGSRTSQTAQAAQAAHASVMVPRGSRSPARGLGAWLIGVIWLGGLAACGGPQHKAEGGGSASHEPPAPLTNVNTETPIDQRRDAACDHLGPKLTACAVEDARANLAAGKIEKQQFERDTAPVIQRKLTEKFLKTCKGAAYSSRQVRVLEVCFREETECAPLLDCLGHLSDKGATKDRGTK